MKKRSEVGVAQFCEANCQSSETPGLAGCVARTEGRASRHKRTGACIDSTSLPCKLPSTRREHAQCFR